MDKFFDKGLHWPLGIVCFFLVVFTVNGYILFQAISNKPASVSSNPYEDSLVFDKKIQANRFADENYTRVSASICEHAGCSLSIVLQPKTQLPLPDSLKARVQKVGIDDLVLELKSILDSKEVNKYWFQHEKLSKGKWTVELLFTVENKDALFRFSQHID